MDFQSQALTILRPLVASRCPHFDEYTMDGGAHVFEWDELGQRRVIVASHDYVHFMGSYQEGIVESFLRQETGLSGLASGFDEFLVRMEVVPSACRQ